MPTESPLIEMEMTGDLAELPGGRTPVLRSGERLAMFHSWRRLAFLHWRFDPVEMQRLLPPGLTVETWEGAAWGAIVPFEMHSIRPWWFPTVPYVSNFLELNVRTYAVDEHGNSGVWFISLSANRRLAVEFGRRWFGLPYCQATIQTEVARNGQIHYVCRRHSDPQGKLRRFRYRPVGTPDRARPDSLESFLVDRYVMFARSRNGELATGRVQHPPYQIQPVELLDCDDSLLELDGLSAPGRPPDHACFVAGVDVEVFALRRGC